MKGKKGLETSTLVGMIIAIISFAVLAVVIGRMAGIFPEEITKETCHSSVLLRGQEIRGFDVGKLASLKCQTEYKCLTMGGECPKGEYAKISVSDEEDIKREIANSMYDCWWMLGEGQINFFGKEALTKRNCIFCSVIHFDDEIQKKYPKIDGLMEYMTKNNIPGKSQTYFSYLFGSINQKDIKPILIDTKQDYVVNFMMTQKGYLRENYMGIANLIAGVASIAVIPFTGGSSLAFYGLVISGTSGITLGGLNLLSESPAGDIIFSLIPFTSESIKAFGCQNIESIP